MQKILVTNEDEKEVIVEDNPAKCKLEEGDDAVLVSMCSEVQPL